MTFEEALTLLGITRSDGPKSVRPAYLRLLKRYKPERDPEGFKRLREAYELAEAQTYLFAREVAYSPAPPFDGAANAASATLAVPLVEAASSEEGARIWSIADDAERLQAAEQFAEARGDADAYELWVEVADAIDDEPAALRALQAACARGLPFLSMLRARFPEALTPGQLDVWQSEAQASHDPDWSELAAALLAQGRADEAAELGARSLAQIEANGSYLDEWTACQLAFALLARAPTPSARRFAERLLAVRDPYSRVDPVRYSALAELMRLRERLPEELMQEIARALERNDPSQADTALAFFANAQPWAARALRKLIRAEAPTLHGLYKDAFVPRFELSTDLGSVRANLSAFLRAILKRPSVIIWPLIILGRIYTPSCEIDPPIVVEVRTTAAGTEYVLCRPQSERVCQAVAELWRGGDCTSRLKAIDRMELAAGPVEDRLTSDTTYWMKAVAKSTREQCETAGAKR